MKGLEQEPVDNYIKYLEAKITFSNYSNGGIADALGFAEYYYKLHKIQCRIGGVQKNKGRRPESDRSNVLQPRKTKSH